MRFRIEAILVAIALGLLGISLLPAVRKNANHTVAEPGTIVGTYLGNIREGENLTAEIRLRNSSASVIRIEGVITSCGCTAVDIPKSDIEPGGEVPNAVAIDTRGRSGIHRFRVSISIAGAPPATVVIRMR
jgi:hypothetical protein